jgi:hypothetical protein
VKIAARSSAPRTFSTSVSTIGMSAGNASTIAATNMSPAQAPDEIR